MLVCRITMANKSSKEVNTARIVRKNHDRVDPNFVSKFDPIVSAR